MKNWKNSVCVFFAIMCVLIFAGCEQMSSGAKPTGTTPGSTGGGDGLNAVEKAIVGSFILPDGIVFKFNSDRKGNKTTPVNGNIRAIQPVQNFSWKADTSGNVSITFEDGSASPVVKFNVDLPNEIKIDVETAIRDGATGLNEYERKLVGFWSFHFSSFVEANYIQITVVNAELKSDGTGTLVNSFFKLPVAEGYTIECPVTWEATETSIMFENTEERSDFDSNLFGTWMDYSISEDGILEVDWSGSAALKRSRIFDELVGIWVTSTEAGTSYVTISPYMTGVIKNGGNSTEYNFVIVEITDTKIIGYQGLDQVEIPYRMKDNRTAFVIPSPGRQDFYEDTHTGTPDIKYVRGNPTQPPESGLNEYERKLLGKWYVGANEMVFNEDKTLSWAYYGYTAKATWNSTVDTLTLNWYEATYNGQALSGQEKENFFKNWGPNPAVCEYTWNDNENITLNVRGSQDVMSRKQHYSVIYYYSGVGAVKTEYVEIGKDYNINFDYGQKLFEYAGVPQKYWNSSDWVFEKYERNDGRNKIEYRPGDSAKIQSPTAYADYLLYIRGTDNRTDVRIVYKCEAVPAGSGGYSYYGDTYWFYNGSSYTKRNETWNTGTGNTPPPRPYGYRAKAGDIIRSRYIENRQNELNIGWVKSSLDSISASDIYERADPAIGWTESSQIELVPVFAAW